MVQESCKTSQTSHPVASKSQDSWDWAEMPTYGVSRHPHQRNPNSWSSHCILTNERSQKNTRHPKTQNPFFKLNIHFQFASEKKWRLWRMEQTRAKAAHSCAIFDEEMALPADISHPSIPNRFLNVFDVYKTRNLLYMNLPPVSFLILQKVYIGPGVQATWLVM